MFCFVVLGGWAAITPLGGAVVASGFVTTEGNKKTIQHLEGGIIKEILIREGQHVEAGRGQFCDWTIRRPGRMLKSFAISFMPLLRVTLGLRPNLMAAQTFNFRPN